MESLTTCPSNLESFLNRVTPMVPSQVIDTLLHSSFAGN